ncbi:uncharacterized protein K452DRAFT_337374 [Aplosporella prunicola CBS 121167]|uniref:NACHT-NTPase and P-loop NTPases N-terminal domain-containing protein n=1 Tax=Aplosporella prunicola CBS 121167 TaxID=1176127 RepID=A0A6A6B6F9_9PEZI|nr:uncharacterized protein K452DRAFT_337374 [Aplosporella prunicola CBS 121167]KAF2139228.1 hypothetical protein K452DRAFT_337374 [Aplosporella prunicola CBS 121167]
MADIAAVGLVSAIVQFADFSCKFIPRFNEFNSNARKAPKSLEYIKTRLPLLAKTLDGIKAQVEAGCVDSATKAAVQEVVDGSFKEIKLLNDIMNEITPKNTDSRARKVIKSFESLRSEEKIQDINKRLKNYIVALTLHQIAPTSVPIQSETGPLFAMPFERDTKFIGRLDIIRQLDDKFSTGRRAALAGIGGVGKSQIAIEYCYRFRDRHPQSCVFWVQATTKARIEQSYREIARKAKLPGHEDPKADMLRLVLIWLSEKSAPQHLIVFDNVDDVEELPQPSSTNAITGVNRDFFIPRSENGKFLITTRDRRIGKTLLNGEEPVKVLPFSPEDSRNLMQSRITFLDKEKSGYLDDLIGELDYLPLAITQAAAFINENDITVEEYLQAFRNDDLDRQVLLSQELDDLRRSGDTPNAVFRSLKLSFDQIARQMRKAADMLSLMAVLDRQGIPKLILRTYSSSNVEYIKSTGTLMAFSLITKEKGGNSFKMHRLVKVCMQHWLELRNESQRWQSFVIKILAGVFPRPNFESFETREVCETLYPHVQASLQYSNMSGKVELMQAHLFSFMAK